MDLDNYPNSRQHEQTKQPLVLAVDDNEDNLQLLTQLLELNNCLFRTAVDGVTAINIAKNEQPDLILLDMMLPDVSGIEVVQNLKQNPQTLKIPIIAVTAMARIEDRDLFISVGCEECITKPYVIEQMEELIQRYIY